MESQEKYDNIEGLVLAGGLNTRFNGLIKSNIEIEGQTIMAKLVDTLSAIFYRVVISTNTPASFSNISDYAMMPDVYKKRGPLGGIHAHLTQSMAEAVFVIAGDMPSPSAKLIRYMSDAYLKSYAEVLIPRLNGKIEPLHAIYSCTLEKRLEEFLTAPNKYSIREFIKLANVEYINIDNLVDSKNTFTNINTSDDLEKYKKSKNS